MKLSIVICVYNTPKDYLRQALESIANSTLRDYEICLVDDGSAEDYTDLATEFGARLQKTANGGILRARLNGISMATGDYLAFVDSDDTVSIHYHQPMLQRAEETGADIVMNDWAFHTEKTRYCCRKDSTLCSDINAEGDDILRLFCAQGGREHSYFVTWNKIYRRELLVAAAKAMENSALGNQNVCYGEDTLINFYAFRDAKRLCNVHTGYYFYRIHANQTVNVVNEERLRAQIMSMSAILALMQSDVGANRHRETVMYDLRRWQELMARTHYSHAKANKYQALYPLIRSAYGVEHLRISTWHDSSVYYKVRLLPSNFSGIDAALRPLFDLQNETVTLRYDRKDRYVARMLTALQNSGVNVRYDADAERQIPTGEIRTADRILHNDLVYATGVLLFPKGSKLRALLKRIL
ncbi:MAG: glycosyltransferase family 2 protein [Clostridia bacterium]|nr:glycosyltransferase family 2 protein [Clostridia bacterium]